MFKRLALVALSTAVVTSPAQANQLKDYIYANPVLSVVHESGTKIFFQGETCSDAYGSYSFEKDEMTICLENHSDYAELGDILSDFSAVIDLDNEYRLECQACGIPYVSLDDDFDISNISSFEPDVDNINECTYKHFVNNNIIPFIRK